jgi:hypothetical protein
MTADSFGDGQAIVATPDGQLNSIIHALHPGDQAVLWGTGLGAIASSEGSLVLHVGDRTANVSYKGRAACCAGLDQIVFEVPAGVRGCHVPVAVEAGGVVSNIGTIAVSASGRTCRDSILGQELVDRLASGETVKFGYIRLENTNSPFQAGTAFRNSVDTGNATFSAYGPQDAVYAQYGVSSGYCVAVDCSNVCMVTGFSQNLGDSSPAQLDAGAALSVDGQGSRTIPRQYGYYGANLNNRVSGSQYLWSVVNYTVSGAGGADVGPFSVTDTTSAIDATVSNLSRGQTVSRSSDLTVQWTGGSPNKQNGQVTIAGFSASDPNGGSYSLFQCTAPVAARNFTIPRWVIGSLPVSGVFQTGTIVFPLGSIWIGQYNTPVAFQAAGLDRGILTDTFFDGVGVYFQ